VTLSKLHDLPYDTERRGYTLPGGTFLPDRLGHFLAYTAVRELVNVILTDVGAYTTMSAAHEAVDES
jgi:hypothetical protein